MCLPIAIIIGIGPAYHLTCWYFPELSMEPMQVPCMMDCHTHDGATHILVLFAPTFQA